MAVSLGRLEVETADHVVLRYDLAGAGTRGSAALLDAFISILMVIGLSIGAVFVGARLPPELALQLSGITAFAILASWVAYFVLLEWMWNGQTIGKRRAGLRVIGHDGEPARFIAVLIRNLLRPVDLLPGTYALGFVMMFLTPSSQRLGDLAAGTYVVRAPKPRMDWLSLRTLDPRFAGPAPVPAAGSVRLSGESQRLVREFVSRERLLAPRDRAKLAAALAGPIRAAVPDIDIAEDVEFLRGVAASLRAMGDTPHAAARLSDRSQQLVREFAARERTLTPDVRARLAASICASVRVERPDLAIPDDVELLRALAREIGASS
jgi:uncharacterized RDD family membrane protein YckC